MKLKPRLKEDLRKYLRQKQQEEENKVTIRTPYQLNKEEIDSIASLFPELNGKSVTQILDESLLAGVVIQHGSKLRDLSLKSQLMNLEQKINEIS